MRHASTSRDNNKRKGTRNNYKGGYGRYFQIFIDGEAIRKKALEEQNISLEVPEFYSHEENNDKTVTLKAADMKRYKLKIKL